MITMVQAFEPRKLVGGAAVLLLHLFVIAALLSTTHWTIQQIAQPKEIILQLLAPKTIPKPEEKKATPAKLPALKRVAPAFVPPSTFVPPPATVPPLDGLNRQLFGCSPDQLAAATAEEHAACASASLGPRYDPGTTDYRDHTNRSKDAALWAHGRALKNAPLLLPCMSPQGFSPLYTLYCLGKSAVEGKIDTQSQLNYVDKSEQIHIPNNGDPPSAPH
jgi:hypothetical protein